MTNEIVLLGISLLLSIFATIFDIKRRIIPNFIPAMFIILGFVRLFIFHEEKPVLVEVIAGLILSSAICLICNFISKSGIGMGDIKLIISLGWFLGFLSFSRVLLVTCISSFAFGVIQLLFFHKKKNTTYPFAPFLMIGILIRILDLLRGVLF